MNRRNRKRSAKLGRVAGRRSTQRTEVYEQYEKGRHALVGVGGLLLAILSCLFIATWGNRLIFWLGRDDYIRTELRITQLTRDRTSEGQDYVTGIVAANGREVRTYPVLYEITTVAQADQVASGVGFRKLSDGEVIGKSIPIWYSDKRSPVYFVYEFPEIPDGETIFALIATNVVLFGLSVLCIWHGVRVSQKWAQAKRPFE